MVWESNVGLKPHFDTLLSRVLSKLLFFTHSQLLVYKTRILSLTALWSMTVQILPHQFLSLKDSCPHACTSVSTSEEHLLSQRVF